VQVKDFNRASEQAVMIKGLYDFSKAGMSGFSAYACMYMAPASRHRTTMKTKLTSISSGTSRPGALRGLSFRLRYAYIEQRGGGRSEHQRLSFYRELRLPASWWLMKANERDSVPAFPMMPNVAQE
jgi:hypothetical protein